MRQWHVCEGSTRHGGSAPTGLGTDGQGSQPVLQSAEEQGKQPEPKAHGPTQDRYSD